MCINLETSILAFGIGELSGLILTSRSPERKAIGLFIMFYTLVQFFEANIYLHGTSSPEIYSKLLLINLGFQGLVFFYLMSQIIVINPVYLFICGVISFFILIEAIKSNFSKATVSGCIKWNFLDSDYNVILLGVMYIIMFYFFVLIH